MSATQVISGVGVCQTISCKFAAGVSLGVVVSQTGREWLLCVGHALSCRTLGRFDDTYAQYCSLRCSNTTTMRHDHNLLPVETKLISWHEFAEPEELCVHRLQFGSEVRWRGSFDVRQSLSCKISGRFSRDCVAQLGTEKNPVIEPTVLASKLEHNMCGCKNDKLARVRRAWRTLTSPLQFELVKGRVWGLLVFGKHFRVGHQEASYFA